MPDATELRIDYTQMRNSTGRGVGSTWFVASTHCRKEALAQDQLFRQGFETFVPRFRKRRGVRAKVELVPLFPGYIFVSFDRNAQAWHPINSTIGVRRLIGSSAGGPLPVPLSAIELLQARCVGGVVDKLVTELEVGARVKLMSGPFAERIATVEGLDAHGRVRVLLDLLGTENSVAVDPQILAPLCA